MAKDTEKRQSKKISISDEKVVKKSTILEPEDGAEEAYQTFELDQDEYEFYSEPVTQEGSWQDLTEVEDRKALLKTSIPALNDPLVRKQLQKQKV